MRYMAIGLLAFLVFACTQKVKINKLEKGRYRALLKVNEVEDLPFNFEVISENKLYIFNADEVIEVDAITYKKDSVYIKMPIFEGYLVAKIKKDKLLGSFVKTELNRKMLFSAEKNAVRFTVEESAKHDISGSWETVFSPDSEEDKYFSKGIFSQEQDIVTGTFRTTTGDYRYLEGVMDGNQLKLSTFDGAHAFLFTATVTDSTMLGTFYSGNHFQESFVAKRNAIYELPDADSLTFLKEGYDKLEFSFPDENGEMVSLHDTRFKDKVVLVQIMGTWCPNCLDESKFYSEFYKNNQDKDLEIVALAFEYVKTEETAFKNIKRLKDKTGITYPVLLAQYGSASKVKAQEKLPMLNHVLSYPTTIFIDKKDVVRKIHTGFNGPATGEKYQVFKKEFEAFVNELLSE
ncbi:TlpA disulfide reductase family protein [Flavivirga algicola]|uniref:TlpA family protein disulfide reductase n=1 Tax=Flavivirga algicola TaxID=2729136 RepID=A0ABX1S225_9FLAO|nr:TlpA disulfide reductase family protein [Flavivirga algicola]NMH89941.1 TlpA family protein disulfide reductase [Flavivirga algicola]